MMVDIPNLKLLVRRAELSSRVPFSEEQMGLLLGNLSECFSEELPDIVKDEETYSLRNSETKVPKQIALTLSKNIISLLWGQETKEKIAINMIKEISNLCTQTIATLPKILQHIDTEYVFDFETNQSHYALIQEVYYSQGAFAKLCRDGRKCLTNDIKYTMLLEDGRILIVSIIGGHAESKIRMDKQGKETLRIRLSVGQTQKLADLSLDELFVQHLAKVEGLVKDELLQSIVIPLANKISNQ